MRPNCRKGGKGKRKCEATAVNEKANAAGTACHRPARDSSQRARLAALHCCCGGSCCCAATCHFGGPYTARPRPHCLQRIIQGRGGGIADKRVHCQTVRGLCIVQEKSKASTRRTRHGATTRVTRCACMCRLNRLSKLTRYVLHGRFTWKPSKTQLCLCAQHCSRQAPVPLELDQSPSSRCVWYATVEPADTAKWAACMGARRHGCSSRLHARGREASHSQHRE